MAEPVGNRAGDAQQPVRPAEGGGHQRAQQPTQQWATAKLILRIVLAVASLITTLVSLVWISAPRNYSGWIILSPLYALPYPLLSLLWEAIELVVLLIHRSKSRGLPPSAHLACELLLWTAGLAIAIVWIVVTIDYQSDSYFEGGASQVSQTAFNHWADVNYFWSAVVILMVMCQFVIFVLSCIEVDRKRRNLERQVNHILQIMEERGQNPEDVLASLVPPGYDSSKPTWPVEMPAMNTNPVELLAEEHPSEMVGDLGGGELPVPGEDANGNQKYVFRQGGP